MSPGLNAPVVDHERYLQRMQPRLQRWQGRSELSDLPWNRRLYAAARVRGIRRPHAERVDRCEKSGSVLRCACRGKRTVRWYGCRQHMVCASCARRRARRMTRRLTDSLAAAAEREPNRKLVLVTLTVRHSGNVAHDRGELAAGWREFYKALHRRGVRFAYAGVVEVTPGRDGLGHVHMHVVALWPWLDWAELRELWLASCSSSERITFVASRRDGKRTNARGAAKYLGKYVSKGVQEANFSPELRADVLAAFYQSRMVFTSAKFWKPFTPCCPCCGQRMKRAIFRWHGVATPGPLVDVDEPGPEQFELGLADPNKRAGPGCS